MIICSDHQDYQVPLIYTYAWNGAEYWCPYCNCHLGMLEAREDVEETEELKKRLKLFKKATEEFRGARGTLICAETGWKGEWVKPKDLPKEEIERLQKIVKIAWKENIKIEDLKDE